MNSSTSTTWDQTAQSIAPLIICPIGLLSSLLTICTLYRKLMAERNVFFILMTLTAIFDLFFNVEFLIFSLITTESISPVRQFASFFVFGTSLASDLCALALTIERYLGLKWPHIQLTKRSQVIAWISIAVGMSTICLLRGAYAVRLIIRFYFPDRSSTWNTIEPILFTFTDMVLPFLLIPIMLVFSCLIIFSIYKRKDKKANAISIGQERSNVISGHSTGYTHGVRDGAISNEQGPSVAAVPVAWEAPSSTTAFAQITKLKREKREKLRAVVWLVILLDVFFILNQIGYCILTMAKLYKRSCSVQECQHVEEFYRAAVFLSDLLELISRSVNFYFYLAFSSLIRKEFYAYLKAIRKG